MPRFSKITRSTGLGWLILCLCLIGQPPVSSAGDEGVRHVVLGYTEYPPYSATNTNLEAQGFTVDMARLLLKRAGYTVSFRSMKNPGVAVNKVRNGDIDMTGLLAMTPSRRVVAPFTSEISQLRVSLITRSGDKRFADGIQFDGMLVGVTAGSVGHQIAKKRENMRLQVYQNAAETSVALLSGEIDGTIQPEEPFFQIAKKAALESRFQVTGTPFLTIDIGFMVRPDRPELLAAVNRAIEELRHTEAYTAIAEKWFGRSYSVWRDPQIAWMVAAGLFIALLAGTALWLLLASRSAKKAQARLQSSHEIVTNALDGLDIVIAIYDTDQRIVTWNQEYERKFPQLVPLLHQDATLEELIAESYRVGVINHTMTEDEIVIFAQKATANLTNGANNERFVTTDKGRILKARDYYLPNGHFVSVRIDITDQKNRETALEAAQSELSAVNERLTRTNEDLENFTRVAAHDLRAPFNSISRLAEWIMEGLTDASATIPEPVAEDIDTIKRLARRSTELVNELLEYTRVNQSNLECVEFDPATRLPGVIEICALPSGFDVAFERSLPLISANPTVFDTVVRNLISNAVKYHHAESGTISVRALEKGDFIVIEIEDDGPGIDPQFHQSIFEPFKRLHRNDEVAGTGLGLSFVKKNVEGWGGTVAVFCPPGGGSIFRFTVPAAEPPLQLAAAG